MTWRQSKNELSGGTAAHPAPKKFRVQKFAGKVLALNIGVQDDIILIRNFQRVKLATASITNRCWGN
jgi:hypothetical protein